MRSSKEEELLSGGRELGQGEGADDFPARGKHKSA